MFKKNVLEKFKEYHFEFKHITVLFVILFLFQLLISFINKASIKDFLSNTQEWYQQDSAEKLANLTATSLELILETINPKEVFNEDKTSKIIQSFDIILSQQILQHNIEEVCVLINKGNSIYAIDEGKVLYNFLTGDSPMSNVSQIPHHNAVTLYSSLKDIIRSKEEIHTILSDKETFHTFVPFVLKGEYVGAVYVKNTPDFSVITNKIISSYDEASIIYLSLILLGLLAMYFISSYTVKERDEAQKLLLKEHEINLKKQFDYEKELIFTKRIYHTHHKAEKVMGFIKGDLRLLSPGNINEVKYRVNKYANFVSRVIYDMKWYDPPVQTIRSQLFKTNLNEVIKFIVENIFQRVSSKSNVFSFKLDLDDNLRAVPVNEFVVWEIIEPIIQNSIEHGKEENLLITIKTGFNIETRISTISISDNGRGIAPELLEKDNQGISRLFKENVSTKSSHVHNGGYGCYIAYEMSKRCGWNIEAKNLETGCEFLITFTN
jgi:hypothetical protein